MKTLKSFSKQTIAKKQLNKVQGGSDQKSEAQRHQIMMETANK